MKFERFEQPSAVDQSDQSSKKEKQSSIRSVELLKDKGNEVSEKNQSAESKIAELNTDGEQQISSVERSIDLSAEDLEAVREEVGLSGHLEKIRDEANSLLGRLKNKLSDIMAKEKNVDITPEKSENNRRQEYIELKDYLKR